MENVVKRTLNKLDQCVNELASNSSTLVKIDLLKEALTDKEVAKLVWLTYNPYEKFHVTSKNCKKLKKKLDAVVPNDKTFKGFTKFLKQLSDSKVTGHDAISQMLGWVEAYPDYETLLYKIIDKDFKCRINVSLINKAKSAGWIPDFKVALAEKLVEGKDTIDEDWFLSRKLDGVRCICMYDKGTVKFLSRKGHEFLTLGVLKDEMDDLATKLKLQQFVLDGELCLIKFNRKGEEVEDFQSVMKELKRKDHTIESPRLKIFDCLTLEEFSVGETGVILSQRLKRLDKLREWLLQSHFDILKQLPCTAENLALMQKEAEDGEWEGLIARKNAPYKGKRSRDMLKLKNFYDDEYVVKDVELGTMQIVDNGKEKVIDALTAVIIEHKGYEVGVGSGFNIKQRQEFFKNPKKIIGKTITVQFFEETRSQNGGISLRFPTVKYIYDGKRDV